MAILDKRSAVLKDFQTNLEDINARPYDPFNVMHVGFNGGSRPDDTDFLIDGLKTANDPTSYAAFILDEQKKSKQYMQRVIGQNIAQARNQQIFDDIEAESGRATTSSRTRESVQRQTSKTSSQETSARTKQEAEHVSTPAKKTHTAKAPEQESYLQSAYNTAAKAVDAVEDTVVAGAKKVKHNLAEAAEAVGGKELRRAGRSALNGDFTEAATHAANATGITTAVHKLSEGASAVKSTIVNAASSAYTATTSTLGSWGKSLGLTN